MRSLDDSLWELGPLRVVFQIEDLSPSLNELDAVDMRAKGSVYVSRQILQASVQFEHEGYQEVLQVDTFADLTPKRDLVAAYRLQRL